MVYLFNISLGRKHSKSKIFVTNWKISVDYMIRESIEQNNIDQLIVKIKWDVKHVWKINILRKSS